MVRPQTGPLVSEGEQDESLRDSDAERARDLGEHKRRGAVVRRLDSRMRAVGDSAETRADG